mgnify:CR=1 FL=1
MNGTDTRVCPDCRQPTEHLKAYRLPTFLLFLGIGASFKHGLVVACPPCMRRRLGKLTLINILPANLLWVLLLLPWYGIAALRTLTSGHSSDAASTPAGPYRQAAGRPAHAWSGPSQPWHQDPALRAFFSSDRPDQLDATFLLGGQIERLPVRLLRAEGPTYVAELLASSMLDASRQAGAQVLVRASSSHAPLVWVPPIARTNLGAGWVARCDGCQCDLVGNPIDPAAASPFTMACAACGGAMQVWRSNTPARVGLGARAERVWKIAAFGTFVLGVLLVGMAGYGSESAGVAAAYAVALPIGFTFGGWRAVPWARRTHRSPWMVPLAGVLVGLLMSGLAIFFFEGIFPSL